MARILGNGLVQFEDSRILYSDTPISGQDFMELQDLLPQINPVIARSTMIGFPLISGGGGGPGVQGLPGPQGMAGLAGTATGLQGATGIGGVSGPSEIAVNGLFDLPAGMNSMVPGLVFTPAAGTYLVYFAGWIQNSGVTIADPEWIIMVGGFPVLGSAKAIGLPSGASFIITTATLAVVNGSQQIQVNFFNIPTGLTLNDSQLMIARVG